MGNPPELPVDPHKFSGQRVLVTAGSQGIGQAVVTRVREGGATVLTTTRTRAADLPNPTLFVTADITTAQGCAIAAEAVRQRLRGIDIIVHVLGGSSAPAGGSRCWMTTSGTARSI